MNASGGLQRPDASSCAPALLLAALLSLALPAAASAQSISGCTKIEARAITEALRNAKRLSLSAAAAVGDTPAYARWFGKYTPRHSETVRRTLKSVHSAIRTGRVTATCTAEGIGACEQSTFAFVYSDRPYRVQICPGFFDLPTMASLDTGARSGDHGTREGTFIHEISHFDRVASTVDNCYSRIDCARLARQDVEGVLVNADSYQYFTEDVTHFRPRAPRTKPGASD